MTDVGRNAPCPCGSGLKFKKCCLGKEAASAGMYTESERREALDELFRFAARAEFAGDREVARLGFWADRLEDLSQDEVNDLFGLGQSQAGFQEWFTFDYRLAVGRTPVELFLERQGARLRSGVRRYLGRMRQTHLRPYEIIAVRLDEGLDLLDLWAKKRISVRERLATRDVVQWEVLAARVVLGPGGEPVMDGLPYRYPPSAKDSVVKAVRRSLRAIERRFPDDDETMRFKRIGALFHVLWLDEVALRPRPALVTPEGDALLFAKVVFDVLDPGALRTALDAYPALDRQPDDTYAWLEKVEPVSDSARRRRRPAIMLVSQPVRPGDEDACRTLGTFALDGNRLVLEAISKARATRGRKLVEQIAGRAVKFRATRYETVERAMERRRAEPRDEVPAEIQARVVGGFFERHYRAWLDERLPALGNRTPREAAGLASARPRVIALLKQMESMAERDRRAGRVAYDFGWMWAELGLDRPG